MGLAATLSVMAAAKALAQDDRRWWAAAGVFGGFLAGVKYTGVITPAVLGAVALFWPRKRALRERFWDAAAVGGTAFLLFLPWLVKNAVFTGGNPVFPFLPSFFPSKNVYLPEAASRAYFQVLDEYKGSSGLLTELFLMPLRLATDVGTFGGGYDVTGDLGWALPLLLLPLGLLLWKRGTAARFFFVYAALHAVLWFAMRPVLRFLFPLFPLACWLAGGGFSQFLEGLKPAARRAGGAFAVLFFLSNGVVFYGVERLRDPFPVALGWEPRGEYLSRKINIQPSFSWCEENLPRDARLLLIGDQRGYRCPRSYVAPMALLPTPLKEWADGCSDGEALRKRLSAEGFTHLVFNRREAERLKSYHVLDLTPSGRRAWDDFLDRGREIRRDASVSVYDLNG
jgi:hypothetical protein